MFWLQIIATLTKQYLQKDTKFAKHARVSSKRPSNAKSADVLWSLKQN
jgi:hypothetical protein